MAVRSDCSASSGRTSSAGGVRLPARCNAASTSTISERRESSEALICCSRTVERAQPRLGLADPGLDAAHLGGDVDQLLIELGAVLPDRGDIGLQLLLQLGRLALLLARGLEFLLALLDGIGGGGGRLLRRRGRTARPPAKAMTAAKLAESSISGSETAEVSGTAAAGGVGLRMNVPR